MKRHLSHFSNCSLLGLCLVFSLLSPLSAAAAVVISEVHYDQASTEKEFIELFNNGGATDITGWTIKDGGEQAFAFSAANSRFGCAQPFVLNAGDRLVLWQGSGTPVCSGPVRQLYTVGTTFLQRDGDTVSLLAADGNCRDFLAYENGAGPAPADCAWNGPNPGNGNVVGISISRHDAGPTIDTDSGSDWEKSGASVTAGPTSPGRTNQQTVLPPDSDGDGVTDAADNCPATANPTQANADADSLGDACDSCPRDAANDADKDNVCGDVDNCPAISNPTQADANGNGIGDACDAPPPPPPPAPVVGKLLITEVNYDQTTTGPEFVEFLATAGPVDITGWTVTDQEEMTFTFSSADSRFGCPQPFALNTGDRLILWQGKGAAVCSGPIRQIFLASTPFLQRDGDDIALRDASSACRDYVAFETGGKVSPPPAGCAWSGPNPNNGNAIGVSISRRDAGVVIDTDSGADWEASGATVTTGPASPGQLNQKTAAPLPPDRDSDGVPDANDNCPTIANLTQVDTDADGKGDACDSCPRDAANDSDGDSVCGNLDNCPTLFNPDQTDANGNGIGDACESCPASNPDPDHDSICDSSDNCPDLYNPDQIDTDNDGIGDACDICPDDHTNDLDDDGLCATADNCPTVFNPDQTDADGDGIGDICIHLLQTVEIPILTQDIKSDTPDIAQHNQQSSARVGKLSGVIYRSLSWMDTTLLPANIIVQQASFVYHTTSGDPSGLDNNGDIPPAGGDLVIELSAVLKPWNYDEPLVLPADRSTADNHKTAGPGETSWRYSLYPSQWQAAGAGGADDHGPVLTSTMAPPSLDTMISFAAPELAQLVQQWLARPADNHGILLKADTRGETSSDSRKVLAGKGFPLETSTTLPLAEAVSHRPVALVRFFPY